MARSRGTWTTEQARVMAAKGRESQARRRANTPTVETMTAESVINGNGDAQIRQARLWANLQVVDNRIIAEVEKAVPNKPLLASLAALSKTLQTQALELGKEAPTRKVHQAPPAAVVLPEPLPEPTTYSVQPGDNSEPEAK